ncbi:hypothetical protein PV597_15820 [Clostridioides difficile]|nr:hypothetical protein [Clostridioides difficile]MDE3563367.1 hypothetical protein [Clostridioides difficile]
MSLYYKEHKIKRRGGVYSEQNIFPSQVEFTSWDDKNFNQNCIAYFDNLSSEKNIGIRGNKELSKQSTRIVVKDNPSMQVPPTIQFEIRPIVTLIENPVIQFDSNSEKHISGACTIKYKIIDNEPNERFIITEKLENKVIAIKSNNVNNNTANDYSINLTDEQIAPLTIGKLYYVTIEISTEAGGLVGSYSYSFTRVNAKPVVEVNSYNSTSAKFIVSDLDNNLSKIEWYLDDVLKETITTDLTTEKTINYELTDNAIHTLKIIATDAENATAEKVLSISKEIMPLQSDATLQDISSKLVEIGEGFKNGKTSIINTLALKNIDASLNNTLVELSEKIKTSFDSSDASVQELQNRITELTNQLSQRKRWARGTFDQTKITSRSTTIPMNLSFTPSIIFVSCGINFNFAYASARSCNLKFFTNLMKVNPTTSTVNDENFNGVVSATVEEINKSSFVLYLKGFSYNGSEAVVGAISGTTFSWTAIE